MTIHAPADEMPDFSHDLVFDKGESGAAQYSYYSLVTDYGSPADILIRVNDRPRSEDNWPKAEVLGREVVKRWNAYNTRPDRMGVEELLAKLPETHSADFFRVCGMWYCGIKATEADDDEPFDTLCFADTPTTAIHLALQGLLAQTPDGNKGEKHDN